MAEADKDTCLNFRCEHATAQTSKLRHGIRIDEQYSPPSTAFSEYLKPLSRLSDMQTNVLSPRLEPTAEFPRNAAPDMLQLRQHAGAMGCKSSGHGVTGHEVTQRFDGANAIRVVILQKTSS
jgi:hypothetical protein